MRPAPTPHGNEMVSHSTDMSKIALAAVLVNILFADGTPADGTPAVTLACFSRRVVAAETIITIDCQLTNPTSVSLYVLADPLILEGPTKVEGNYLHRATGGNRFENVLQFNRSSELTLDLPYQIKPAVHLPLKSLSNLVKVRKSGSTNLRSRWKLEMAELPDRGAWIMRVKLIYLPADKASTILSGDTLTPVCREILARSLARSQAPREIALDAVRHLPNRRYTFDGCRDVISREFMHLWSNTMTIEVVPTQAPRRPGPRR
jgi:hypothetical protein